MELKVLCLASEVTLLDVDDIVLEMAMPSLEPPRRVQKRLLWNVPPGGLRQPAKTRRAMKIS